LRGRRLGGPSTFDISSLSNGAALGAVDIRNRRFDVEMNCSLQTTSRWLPEKKQRPWGTLLLAVVRSAAG
jgi:hypothetical protein